MVNIWILILGFGLLGALIKYIDQAYDVGIFDKKKAIFFGVLCGLLMGSFVIFDYIAGLLLLSFVIFALITKKVDNPPFYIITILSFLIPSIAGLYGFKIEINWFVFGTFIFSGIIDEEGNRRSYRGKLPNQLSIFFRYRCFMKIVVFILALLNYYSLIYFIAFMAYDLAYLGVALYSQNLLKTKLSRGWPLKKVRF